MIRHCYYESSIDQRITVLGIPPNFISVVVEWIDCRDAVIDGDAIYRSGVIGELNDPTDAIHSHGCNPQRLGLVSAAHSRANHQVSFINGVSLRV
jgi:hypothetical protein